VKAPFGNGEKCPKGFHIPFLYPDVRQPRGRGAELRGQSGRVR